MRTFFQISVTLVLQPNYFSRNIIFFFVPSITEVTHFPTPLNLTVHGRFNTPLAFYKAFLLLGLFQLAMLLYTSPAAAAAVLLQSCPSLCEPIDGSSPGSPVPDTSSGKNTGVGWHFLLQRMKVKSESEVAQSCPTLRYPMDCSLTKLLHPWDFLGKSTGVGCHCLLLTEWTMYQIRFSIGGEWTYVYVWCSPFAVHLKLSQHC